MVIKAVKNAGTWLYGKRDELVLNVLVMPALLGVWAWISSLILEPGPIRDIGFCVFSVVAIAGTAWIIVERGKIVSPKVTVPIDGDSSHDMIPFEHKLLVYHSEVNTKNITKENPFLIITFWIFNGSDCSVRIRRLHGHVKCNANELSLNAELRSEIGLLRSGHRDRIIIRQWLLPADVERFAKVGWLGFDSVHFYVGPLADKTVEKRVPLPSLTTLSEDPWHIDWRNH